MRITRKLTLLAAMAIAAIVLTAPLASAQEPLAHHQAPELTATNELTGTPCPAVTPSPAPNPGPTATAGGCRLHVSGPNIVLASHVFGIESVDSSCNTEFDGRMDASAEGYVTHVELTQGTQGTCTRRPCGASAGVEGRAWSAYGRETAPGARQVTVVWCLWTLSGTSNTHCEVSVPFTEPTNHRYTGIASDSPCHGVAGFRGELTGTWNVETTPATNGEGQLEQQVEINHT